MFKAAVSEFRCARCDPDEFDAFSWPCLSWRKFPEAPREADASARSEARASMPVEEGELSEQIFFLALYPST
jgi:hypothetical protein